MDETTLTQEPYLCKCWSKCGKQPLIPYPAGSHWNVHCFGGYNLKDNTVAATIAENRNTTGFIGWLEHLMTKAYPTGQILLILDNASFHKGEAVEAVRAHYKERLTFFFLPAYSPELNPIEGYWKHLKRQVHGNHLCHNKQELTERLHKEVRRQNDAANPKRYHLCN